MAITLPVRTELISGDYKDNERNNWVVTQGDDRKLLASLSLYRDVDTNRVVIEVDAVDANAEAFVLKPVVQVFLTIPGARALIKTASLKFDDTLTQFPTAKLVGFNGHNFDCYVDVSKETRLDLVRHQYDVYAPIQRWYLREKF